MKTEDRQNKEIIRAAATLLAYEQGSTVPQPSECSAQVPKRRGDWWTMAIVGLLVAVGLAVRCGVVR